jgi:hypothetical protein
MSVKNIQEAMKELPEQFTKKYIKSVEDDHAEFYKVACAVKHFDDSEVWQYLSANAFEALFDDDVSFRRFEKSFKGGNAPWLGDFLSFDQKCKVAKHCIEIDGFRHTINYDDLDDDESESSDDIDETDEIIEVMINKFVTDLRALDVDDGKRFTTMVLDRGTTRTMVTTLHDPVEAMIDKFVADLKALDDGYTTRFVTMFVMRCE